MHEPHTPATPHQTHVPEGAAAWDERYSAAPSLFSGRPNHSLVRLVEGGGDRPGRALDVGCGEGGDAVWLAGQGWEVTGVDISSVALGRAADSARAAGVGDRITWVRADLATDPLPPGVWDLVNAQYLHLRPDQRAALWVALAARVAPGGMLLVAAHDRSDPHVAEHLASDPGDPETADRVSRFHGSDEVLDALGEGWDVAHAGPLRWTRRDGPEGGAVDLVVQARRRP